MAGVAEVDQGAAPAGRELLGAREGRGGIGAAGDDYTRRPQNRWYGPAVSPEYPQLVDLQDRDDPGLNWLARDFDVTLAHVNVDLGPDAELTG